MNIDVVITYDPATDTWSAENPIKVKPGVTTITWRLELASKPAGMITFGTEPTFEGIAFRPGWPGTAPKGTPEMWKTTIEDDLKPGDKPRKFAYTVNAWYTPVGAAVAEQKSWDPDVEEDPPN